MPSFCVCFTDSKVVLDPARHNRFLPRGSLHYFICAGDRVCWPQTSQFCGDLDVDILHKFFNATKWIGIWNTGVENTVHCDLSASISITHLLEVRILSERGRLNL